MSEPSMNSDTTTVVQVVTRCEYFRIGMEALFFHDNVTLRFIHCIDELMVDYDNQTMVLLVLDMSGPSSLKEFKSAVDYLNQTYSPKKIGVLVSRYNEYLTQYISRKFHGRVTFFNSHNLQSGLFYRNFTSWLKGKAQQPMRVVSRFCDDRYRLTLKEWITLVIPLSGETMNEISLCMGIRSQTLYQIRQNALRKIGIGSYREFCELYLNGKVRTENSRIVLR